MGQAKNKKLILFAKGLRVYKSALTDFQFPGGRRNGEVLAGVGFKVFTRYLVSHVSCIFGL